MADKSKAQRKTERLIKRLIADVEGMPAEELQQLYKDLEHVTTTRTYWALYQLKPFLAELVAEELAQRETE